MAKSRTILIWHNNGEQQFTFTVNPERLRVSRPNCNRVERLAMGGTVNLWGGRGLREVSFTTFLPEERSPFYGGTDGAEVLSLLKAWQDSGDPVRLIVSGSDINDAFLIEDVTETLREGDGDITLTLTLREYKFASELAKDADGAVQSAGKTARADERVLPKTRTVKRGGHALGHRLRAVRRRDALARDRKEKRRDRAAKITGRKGAGAVKLYANGILLNAAAQSVTLEKSRGDGGRKEDGQPLRGHRPQGGGRRHGAEHDRPRPLRTAPAGTRQKRGRCGAGAERPVRAYPARGADGARRPQVPLWRNGRAAPEGVRTGRRVSAHGGKEPLGVRAVHDRADLGGRDMNVYSELWALLRPEKSLDGRGALFGTLAGISPLTVRVGGCEVSEGLFLRQA